MHPLKNASLYQKCHAALSDDNVEMCLQDLSLWITNDMELINLRARLSALKRKERNGVIAVADAQLEHNQIRMAAIEFLQENVTDEGEDAILDGIHNRIIVVAAAERQAEWRAMFHEKIFSHVRVLVYEEAIPDDYRSSDVVIFDGRDVDAGPEMRRCAAELRQAHFLFFGERNPLTDSRRNDPQDAAIFDRCANANSKFTLHARLRELLDFRRIYGLPAAGDQ